MFRKRDKEQKRKLKKQPRLQRTHAGSTAATPKLVMPEQTKKRVQRRKRARTQQQLTLPLHWLKQIVFSSRWLSLALLSTAVYALYFIGQQPSYQISQVPIEGLYAIPATEVLAYSGLAGQHIFSIDPEAVAERINQTPGIIGATVEVSWPNQARVTVQEDTPVAVILQGEETLWVNEAGDLLPARLDIPELLHIQTDVPLAMGLTQEQANVTANANESASESENASPTLPGQPVQMVEGRVPTAVLEGAQQLRTLLPDQNSFRYTHEHGLIYDDPQGWAVYFGTGNDMHQKLAVYNVLLNELRTQGVTPAYISVSNQQQPFYRALGGE